jgi:hypothetical protein
MINHPDLPNPASSDTRAAALDQALASYADGRAFTATDLRAILALTGCTRTWLYRALHQRVEAGLLVAHQPREDSGLYQVIDPRAIQAAARTRRAQLTPRSTPMAGPQVTPVGVELAELASLALRMGSAARVPALMLTFQPAQLHPVTCRRVDCHPAPILAIDQGVLYGDLATANGQVAAGALAHQIACQAHPPTPGTRWATRLLGLSFLAVFTAGINAAPALVIGTAIAATIAVILAWSHLQRRAEYAIDATAARLLRSAGLDGTACLTAMLTHLATTEGPLARIGWILSAIPTASARRRALTSAQPSAT